MSNAAILEINSQGDALHNLELIHPAPVSQLSFN